MKASLKKYGEKTANLGTTQESFNTFITSLESDLLDSSLYNPMQIESILSHITKNWEDYKKPYIRILEEGETLPRHSYGRASWSQADLRITHPDTLNIYWNDILDDYMAEFAHQIEHNPLGLNKTETLMYRDTLRSARTDYFTLIDEYARDKGLDPKKFYDSIAYGEEILINGVPIEVYSVPKKTADTNKIVIDKVPYDKMSEEDWDLVDLARQELWKQYNSEFYTHEIIEKKLWDEFYKYAGLDTYGIDDIFKILLPNNNNRTKEE